VPVVDPVPDELDPSDCDWRAAIRLCRNCWNACTVVVPFELDAADVLDVDAELLVTELALVADAVVPTPIDCSAWRIAAISPPPSGGGAPAAAMPDVLLLDDVPEF